MNLTNKKQIAAKALKVGKNRIVFNAGELSEIKEAITKQDIKDLYAEGIITIKPVKGRKKIKKRKRKRGPGKIKKKVKNRKQEYVKLTRKLREYVKQLKNHETIDRENYLDLRKKIRMRFFKSKANLKEYLKNIELLKTLSEKPAKKKNKASPVSKSGGSRKNIKKPKENKR